MGKEIKFNEAELFLQISEILAQSKRKTIQNINTTMVHTYFEIGRLIVEYEQKGKVKAEYAKSILKNLSKKLSSSFGIGFSPDNLENMRKFYITYAISETVSRKLEFRLSWSHYVKFMRIEGAKERRFYEIEALENNWSVRELKRQINTALYQRLVLSKDKEGVRKLNDKGQTINIPQDAIKDPYILEFLGLDEKIKYSESDLESKIISKMGDFLLELGKGYAFVARQKKITISDDHFYIDLVFYNYLLKSFVIIDLKIGDLKHQDLGQLQMYVNYYDRFIKSDSDNKTVGIILSADKNDNVVKITLPEDNEQIFASKYKMYLPSKKELEEHLESFVND